MIYLLDTDMLISMIRGLKSVRSPARHRQAQRVLTHCRRAAQAGDSVGLSSITVSELEFGARCSVDYQTEIAAVRQITLPFDSYDYDAVACPAHYGRIRQELESRGASIGAMDLLIAAHALALGATLISNNHVHFSRVPSLMLGNWMVP
jgi:tRNA(fMet)-specific endonuclease VapC